MLLTKLVRHQEPALDLTPVPREASARGILSFFPAQTHLNSAGHGVMAAVFAPWLESLGFESGSK